MIDPRSAEASAEAGAPLLLATTNPGKLREFRCLFPDLRLLSPDDLQLQLTVSETGTTFHPSLLASAFSFLRTMASEGQAYRIMLFTRSTCYVRVIFGPASTSLDESIQT